MHPSLRNVNAFHPICILNVNFQDLFYQKAIFLRILFYFFLLFSKKKLQDKCLYLFWKAKSWKRQSCLLVTQSQANVDFLRFKHPIHMMMIRIFAFFSLVMPKTFPYFVIQMNWYLTKRYRVGNRIPPIYEKLSDQFVYWAKFRYTPKGQLGKIL